MSCGIPFTIEQLNHFWSTWHAGLRMTEIAACLGRSSVTLRRMVDDRGGIKPMPRKRSSRALSLAEREEISRGLSAGKSFGNIAAALERSTSTISREVRRNGGRECYQAGTADEAAWARARRPNTTVSDAGI